MLRLVQIETWFFGIIYCTTEKLTNYCFINCRDIQLFSKQIKNEIDHFSQKLCVLEIKKKFLVVEAFDERLFRRSGGLHYRQQCHYLRMQLRKKVTKGSAGFAFVKNTLFKNNLTFLGKKKVFAKCKCIVNTGCIETLGRCTFFCVRVR